MDRAAAEVWTYELLRGQQDDSKDEKREVEQLLAAVKRAASQPVRVEIAQQQRELEEDEAGKPYRLRTAECG